MSESRERLSSPPMDRVWPAAELIRRDDEGLTEMPHWATSSPSQANNSLRFMPAFQDAVPPATTVARHADTGWTETEVSLNIFNRLVPDDTYQHTANQVQIPRRRSEDPVGGRIESRYVQIWM